MTAAARSFWPSVAGSLENLSPAPFGREPSGRSTARAAAATASAVNEPPATPGSTALKRAQAAENPEMPSSVGPGPALAVSGPEIV